MYVWILDVRTCWGLKIDSNGERGGGVYMGYVLAA